MQEENDQGVSLEPWMHVDGAFSDMQQIQVQELNEGGPGHIKMGHFIIEGSEGIRGRGGVAKDARVRRDAVRDSTVSFVTGNMLGILNSVRSKIVVKNVFGSVAAVEKDTSANIVVESIRMMGTGM